MLQRRALLSTAPRRTAPSTDAVSSLRRRLPRHCRSSASLKHPPPRLRPPPASHPNGKASRSRSIRLRAFPIAANRPAPSFNPAYMRSPARTPTPCALTTSHNPPDSRAESGMIHRTPTESPGRGQCRQRWMRTIGRTRLRCFAPACRVVGGKLRTIAASSRRCISSPSRTFAGARCRSVSANGTACGSASIA